MSTFDSPPPRRSLLTDNVFFTDDKLFIEFASQLFFSSAEIIAVKKTFHRELSCPAPPPMLTGYYWRRPVVCVFYSLIGIPLNIILIGALGSLLSNKVNTIYENWKGGRGGYRIFQGGRILKQGGGRFFSLSSATKWTQTMQIGKKLGVDTGFFQGRGVGGKNSKIFSLPP